jgi:hypothetical protein
MVLPSPFWFFALLSLLLPVMVISGGCMFFWSVKKAQRWSPKIARRDPATGEGCQIRLPIKLSNDAVVKSAFPIIVQPCPQPVSAPRR